jgi:hypothetical protein
VDSAEYTRRAKSRGARKVARGASVAAAAGSGRIPPKRSARANADVALTTGVARDARNVDAFLCVFIALELMTPRLMAERRPMKRLVVVVMVEAVLGSDDWHE